MCARSRCCAGAHPGTRAAYHEYPHRLSGGMRQRVMIAMALACGPKLLIADEPTTALRRHDPAQILDLMRTMREETGTAIILIKHDLGVIAEVADEVAVMYSGGSSTRAGGFAIRRPATPYTIGLLGSIPQLTSSRRACRDRGPGAECATPVSVAAFILAVRSRSNVVCAKSRPLVAVRGDMRPRCGVLARALGRCQWWPLDYDAAAARRGWSRFPDPWPPVLAHGRGGGARWTASASRRGRRDAGAGRRIGVASRPRAARAAVARADVGKVFFDGEDLFALSPEGMRAHRRAMQIIFRTRSRRSIPRMTVGQTLGEPLALHGLAQGRRPETRGRNPALVGLAPEHARRYPHEFSGGQRQRIGIARALAVEPRLIVCDEPVSALDVSIQAQVINLLRDLQSRLGLSYVFIAHDLAVVKFIATRIAVMYLGKIVEYADRRALFASPRHPIPRLRQRFPCRIGGERRRVLLEATFPAEQPAVGVPFPYAVPVRAAAVREEEPPLVADAGHAVACPTSGGKSRRGGDRSRHGRGVGQPHPARRAAGGVSCRREMTGRSALRVIFPIAGPRQRGMRAGRISGE